MGFNAFFAFLWDEPGAFNRAEGPIESDGGFVYEAWEASSRWSENR